jgi:soluble lytic murein transglycosylase-like protein
MSIGPRLVVQGAILGSMILALFGFIVTAGAAPLNSSASDAVANSAQSADPKAQKNGQKTQDGKQKKSKNEAGCEISDKYPANIRQWCDVITRYAKEHGLEPNLVAAVMYQESGGQPDAYSHSGAVGLMQVMPRDGLAADFMCAAGPCFASRPTIEELKDPEFNVDYGTRMLAGLQSRLGSLRDALKSYGPKDVGYYYADIVLSIYDQYR